MKSRARCEVCGVFLALAKTGRPKRFCSTRCRVKAHRRRQSEPTTLHEALGTDPA